MTTEDEAFIDYRPFDVRETEKLLLKYGLVISKAKWLLKVLEK